MPQLVNIFTDLEFDELIKTVYNIPYKFNKQSGVYKESTVYFNVPCTTWVFKNKELPYKLDTKNTGVPLDIWLNIDSLNFPCVKDWDLEEFKYRCFYPYFDEVINDLYSKGHLLEGNYGIKTDFYN